MRGAVIKARVGEAQAPQLISYLDTIPLDEDKKSHSHGRRITSNPLMLSMVISLYERREQGGVAMPTRIVELYAEATSAMLSRALGDYSSSSLAATITALLQAIFFCAHAAQHRRRQPVGRDDGPSAPPRRVGGEHPAPLLHPAEPRGHRTAL